MKKFYGYCLHPYGFNFWKIGNDKYYSGNDKNFVIWQAKLKFWQIIILWNSKIENLTKFLKWKWQK